MKQNYYRHEINLLFIKQWIVNKKFPLIPCQFTQPVTCHFRVQLRSAAFQLGTSRQRVQRILERKWNGKAVPVRENRNVGMFLNILCATWQRLSLSCWLIKSCQVANRQQHRESSYSLKFFHPQFIISFTFIFTYKF